MAHIKLPEFEEMAPNIQERARPILEKTGELGEIFKLMAVDEKVYFATDMMVQNYLLNETTLPYIAKMLGLSEEKIEKILHGVDSVDTDEKGKSLLKFCIRASQKDSYKILKEEIDALKDLGYSDVQILEAVAITGYFNYINTLSNVFGLSQ